MIIDCILNRKDNEADIAAGFHQTDGELAGPYLVNADIACNYGHD